MAHGLLVSYAGAPYTLSSLFPDNGLASLAAVLRAAGHECVVWDLNTAETMARTVEPDVHRALVGLLPRVAALTDEDARALAALSRRVEARAAQVVDDLAARIVAHCRARRVDFVGFKLWNGDGYEASIRIAERLRRDLPHVRLFAGGPSVHYGGDVVAADAPVFDAVVDGDAEEAILELARWVEGKRPLDGVPNLVLPAGGMPATKSRSDLATLPVPEYGPETYPAIARGEKIKLFCIDESRGCPMGCAFCINRCIEGAEWRTRTPDQVVGEIRGLHARFGAMAFRLTGTYSPPALLTAICDQLIAARLDVQFGAFLHARAVNPALVARLKAAGCFGLFVGVESGSDAILGRAMRKSVSAATMRAALEACLRAGLFVAGSFIFPAPFETAETEAETRRLIREVFSAHRHAAVNVCFPVLVPRTGWWTDRAEYGFALEVADDDYRRLLLRYKGRHTLPPALWPELPYTLGGARQAELARRSGALQRWVGDQNIGINLADHDAQIGAALGDIPADFASRLGRLSFTGDAAGLEELVRQANCALSPGPRADKKEAHEDTADSTSG